MDGTLSAPASLLMLHAALTKPYIVIRQDGTCDTVFYELSLTSSAPSDHADSADCTGHRDDPTAGGATHAARLSQGGSQQDRAPGDSARSTPPTGFVVRVIRVMTAVAVARLLLRIPMCLSLARAAVRHENQFSGHVRRSIVCFVQAVFYRVDAGFDAC